MPAPSRAKAGEGPLRFGEAPLIRLASLATPRKRGEKESRHQFFSWIIRSTERRAFAAIIGSITTSSFMYTRLSRTFGSVMRFMCGQ